jgi:hypothetical protein
MLDSAPRKRVMPMALLRACARLACKVREVTVRHSSPRRIRSASALPRSNHCDVGCPTTVVKKNKRRIPAIDAPATRLGGSAGSSLARSSRGFSRSYAESPTSALSTSSSGTLRKKPSRVRPKLGERPWATRVSSHSSARLWSLVTRRRISDPLVNEATPVTLHRVKQDGRRCFPSPLSSPMPPLLTAFNLERFIPVTPASDRKQVRRLSPA